ncbi:MAG: Na+/H+ antiporter subunit D [Phycisphaeraceae bacterium]|nr:MAG: Na+/H+ antiporter subunit D [Phycisphaeraceae bacterium]
MSSLALILPLLIPLATAGVGILAWRSRRLQRAIGLIGSVVLVIASVWLFVLVREEGIQSLQIANWQAPFGITLVGDLLSVALVLATAVMGVCVIVYSFGSVDRARESFFYYPLMHVLLMGINGAFLTGDLFNLYVWFEVMLISSFVLLALGGERAQLEGALKYVTLNLASSVIFLTGIGVVYGVAGTLNFADLALKLSAFEEQGIVTTLSMILFITFGVKAAIFPLFFWLPASYHTPPAAVSAIFAGMLTKVGVYALIRVFTLIFNQDISYTHTLILVVAGFTMVTGVLGAAAQHEFRRILSFHIISQIGYMIMGLGLMVSGNPAAVRLAIAGAFFYIIHNIVAKSNLFLISGVANKLRGSYELSRLGGLYASNPALSLLFLISAFALAGVPPLSGFFGKLMLVRAGLEAEAYVIVAVALGVGLLTLFSMTKIWAEAFWKPAPDESDDESAGESPGKAAVRQPGMALMMAPIIFLAVLAVALGVFFEPVYNFSIDMADQILDPRAYIEAVLPPEYIEQVRGGVK